MKFLSGYKQLIYSMTLLAVAAWPVAGMATSPGPTGQIIMQSTPTEPAVQYSNSETNLPVCPSQTRCPDINGNPPELDNSPSCPDTCTVTQQVLGTPPRGITEVKNAVCPSGYVQNSSYNSQYEYKRYTTRRDLPFPIKDMTTYNEYIAQGAYCGPVASAPANYDVIGFYCSGDEDEQAQGYHWGHHNAAMSQFYAMGGAEIRTAPSGNVVTVGTNPRQTSCFPVGSSCSGTGAWCGAYHRHRWDYSIAEVSCYFPPGIWPTGRYTNATLVCGRTKSVWRPAGEAIVQ